MKEYTFLMSNSFCSKHIKAHNLREAFKKVKIWQKYNKIFGSKLMKKEIKNFTGLYQECKEGDFIMSGWKQIRDKKILTQI